MASVDCHPDGVMNDDKIIPSLKVGIVVERRKLDNPWIDYEWRVVGVVPGVPEMEDWTVLRAGDGWVQFHAGNLTIQLFERETEGYRYNLSSPPPSVYVVMRTGMDVEGPEDVEPFLATICPYEAESYAESGDEIVDAVTMPAEILSWVQDYVTKYHKDEPFKKRKRKSYDPRKGGAMGEMPPMMRDGKKGGA